MNFLNMKFWSVEVKAGKKLTVLPLFAQKIHISQASMCEMAYVIEPEKNKKKTDVYLRLKIGGDDFIMGSLSAAKCRTQVMFDLTIDTEFELSHNLKRGSVYFMGYTIDLPISEVDFNVEDATESEEEKDLKSKEIDEDTCGDDGSCQRSRHREHFPSQEKSQDRVRG